MRLITLFIVIITLFTVSVALADKKGVIAIVEQVAPKHGMDPKLVIAIIAVESNFNPKAIGKSHGEVGLMQLHPKYFKGSFDPKKNIEMGVKYLASLKKRCYPRYRDAWFICYNLGPNRKTAITSPTEFVYYKKVINAQKKVNSKTDRVRIASN